MNDFDASNIVIRLSFALFLTATSIAPVAAQTEEASNAYLKRWLQNPDTAGTFSGRAPRFRYADVLAEGIADRDTDLVAALTPLLATSREAELKLLALEIAALRRTSAVAESIATQLDSLVALVRERPAAGPSGQIERETLSGVAIRFHAAAAEARALLPAMERQHEELGGLPTELLGFPEVLPAPIADDADTLLTASPLPEVARLLIQRKLTPLTPTPTRTSVLETVFVDEGKLPPPSFIHWGGGDTAAPRTRDAMLEGERAVIREAIQRRLDAMTAWTAATATIPPARIREMNEAADLALRQYRQGAIPLSLLIQSQDAWFDAMQKSQELHLLIWREALELGTLTGRLPPAMPAQKQP